VSGTPSPQAWSGHHLREDALAYAEAGFAVFPLQRRDKQPLTEHGYLDATRDRSRVVEFWRRHPGANIGLAVPRDLVVVDVDNRDALLRLKAEDRHLPATARCATGRGLHFYYRTTAEIHNAVGLFPGVDLRGQGGYVVVPPSIHPSGARYRWEVPLSPTSLADAPAWLIEAVAQKPGPRPRPPEEWRKLTQQGVGEGERNNSVASFAGHLLRREVDPFVVLQLLLAWNATRCRPPLPEAEVARTVDSIAGREMRRRHSFGF
jgi:hypothetical protein